MPRLEDLPDLTRQGMLNFPAFDHDDSPCARMTKPLTEAKIALVTTAGLHLRDDTPFSGGDQTYRVIPSSAPASGIIQSHMSIGFDRTGIMRDVNVTFPIDRLREMAERGEIGSVTENYYSFMGAQRSPRRIEEETGPEVGRLLLEEGADAAFLTPT